MGRAVEFGGGVACRDAEGMIHDIRNPWIRRTLCVILAIPYVVAMVITAISEALMDIVDAWRGSKGRK